MSTDDDLVAVTSAACRPATMNSRASVATSRATLTSSAVRSLSPIMRPIVPHTDVVAFPFAARRTARERPDRGTLAS